MTGPSTCNFTYERFCGRDDTTGKMMETEEIKKKNNFCPFLNKWNCPKMTNTSDKRATRPGSCVADVVGIQGKIKIRETSIKNLEIEIAHKQKNLDIIRSEIEEYKTLSRAKKQCPECGKPLIWEQCREIWFCQEHGRFEIPEESKCSDCNEPDINTCLLCEDRPWKFSCGKQKIGDLQ